MSDKTKKTEKQLDDLIRKGVRLETAMKYECYTAKITKQLEKTFGKEETKGTLKKYFIFRGEYQSWYSESLAVVKQVLPDRVDDFSLYYEYPRLRKEITYSNYMVRDYLKGIQVNLGDEAIVDSSAAIPEFLQQLSIVKAAKEVLNSTLIDLTSILQADLFDSEVDSARALLQNRGSFGRRVRFAVF